MPVGWGLSAQNVMWMPMEGFLRLFGGPGDQKVVVWPVASWADKPLASFGVELGSVTLACFLVFMTLASFWALEPMA